MLDTPLGYCLSLRDVRPHRDSTHANKWFHTRASEGEMKFHPLRLLRRWPRAYGLAARVVTNAETKRERMRRVASTRKQIKQASGLYRALIRPGDLCFDVGAHQGTRVKALRQAGGRVVAVEPQPDFAASLASKWWSDPEVTILECALGAVEGTAELRIPANASTLATMSDHWSTGRFRDVEWTSSVQVRVTTLDALISWFGVPQFCKIDVEGFERAVLQGLTHVVPLVAFEFHAEFMEEAEACLEELSEIGRITVTFSVGESMSLGSEWTGPRELINQLRRIKSSDPNLWGDIYAAMQPPGTT